jgi:formate/nitrite transporter
MSKTQNVCVYEAPDEIAETLFRVGKEKSRKPTFNLVILGLLAGAFIAFGGVLETVIITNTSEIFGLGITRFLAGSVFSVGLILVIVAGAELFTGNNLIIVGLLTGEVGLSEMLRNWTIVYVSNFVGSIAIVWLVYWSGIWKTGGGAVGATMVSISLGKVSLAPMEAFVRGILCNMLVVLAVWMAAGAKDVAGKIGAIYFPIMAFVAMGFEHCIANMYLIPIGIVAKSEPVVQAALGAEATAALSGLTWKAFLWNVIPVTVGNVVGGALFIGAAYYLVYLKPERDRYKAEPEDSRWALLR